MSLRIYQYGAHTIGTRVVFPELPRALDSTPTVLFELSRRCAVDIRTARRVHEWRTTDGRVRASLHRAADEFVIHFKRLARFQMQGDLAAVRCTPCPSRPTALVRHLFLDQVMPLRLSLGGEHVMHASAVEYGGRAVAFVGESGAGKSTIAATLGQGDGRILADDCVVFNECGGEFLVNAPYASLRLWEDSAAALGLGRGQAGHRSGKRRFARSSGVSFAAGPSPLGAVCLLDRSRSADRARLTMVPPAEALVLLVRSTFKFDITDRPVLEREFRFLSRFVASVPCYRLTIPDSLDALPSLCQLAIDAVQGGRTRRIA